MEKTMSLKLVTFKTNHTIMASVEVKEHQVELKEPVQVVVQPTKEGPTIAFVPFLEFCEEFKSGIKISLEDVLCITEPVTELRNQYNHIFGSGIEIASSIPKI
jgi:hypothetical protein